MNTKKITDKTERKKLKRAARKKAGSEGQARRRRGARIHEEESQEDGEGSGEALIRSLFREGRERFG